MQEMDDGEFRLTDDLIEVQLLERPRRVVLSPQTGTQFGQAITTAVNSDHVQGDQVIQELTERSGLCAGTLREIREGRSTFTHVVRDAEGDRGPDRHGGDQV
uniref:hypothetical protein n=1 Tax=Actinomadura spongiicola TaxID=2303421 RepID=UPI001F345EF1|nr:hypothetical protein [Actinomadura spongiicola]